MSQVIGMLAVKKSISDEIAIHVEEYLSKGNKITIIESREKESDRIYKPVKESISYAF